MIMVYWNRSGAAAPPNTIKETDNMKKILSLILAAAILAATGLILTGCGEDKKEAEKTYETTAPAQQTTEAGTLATEQTESQTTGQTPTYAAADATDGQSADAGDAYAGVSQDEALNLAVNNVPGYYANSIYQGTAADGTPAWVVQMVDENGNETTCYIKSDGTVISDMSGQGSYDSTEATAYPDGDSDAETTVSNGNSGQQNESGLSQDAAVNMAISDVGNNSYVDSVYYGNDNNGNPCWVVVTNNANGNRYISFVSDSGVVTNPYDS